MTVSRGPGRQQRRRRQKYRGRHEESLLLNQQHHGADSLRGTMSAYLDAQLPVRGEGTLAGWGSCLLYFAKWCEERGLFRPAEVTRPLLERYQRFLFFARRKDGKPLTVATQHRRLVEVRKYFRWCVRQNLLLANPASDMELPRLGRRLPSYRLSVEEVDRVLAQPRLDTAVGLRDRAILEVLWACGLRRGEVARLRSHDVRHDMRTLFVRLGKGRKDRHVPISPRALQWVARYVEEARPVLLRGVDDGFLFVSNAGEVMSVNSITFDTRRYLDAAGVQAPGSTHLFRHACASALLEAGVDVRYLQEFLGHASIETTQVYTHVSLAQLQRVYEAAHPSAKAPESKAAASAPLDVAAVLDELEDEAGDGEGDQLDVALED